MVSVAEIETLYNSIPTPCVIITPDTPDYVIAAVNNDFIDLTHTKRTALVGRKFFEAFPANATDDGSQTKAIINAFEHVLSAKTPCLIKQHRYSLPVSVNHPVQLRYWNIETYPILDETGNIQYIVQSSTDVTALVEAERKLEENNRKLSCELAERKQVEEALQLRNDLYKYVNKATNDAIYDWSINDDHIEWGDAFYRLFGYTRQEEFPLAKWVAVLHPEDVPVLEKSLKNALENHKKNSWTAGYRLKKANCSYAFVEENGYIIRDENGRATRMIGVVRDVTARKEAEAEIESIKNTYSDLFHLSPLPMWVYDLNSLKFLDVNNAAIAHYGYSRNEFLTMKVVDIRPRQDAEAFVNVISKQIKPGKYHALAVRHRKKSGEIIHVSARGNSIRYGSKEARVVVAIDITEKIKSEQALIDSERRFKRLIQEGSDLISILETTGFCKYVSPTTSRVLKIPPQEFLHKNAFDLIYEPDRERVLLQFALLNNQKCVELSPFRFVDKYGKLHWVETVITDMRNDEAIAGIVANSRIVTDRIENELKIKEHLERYNAVSKATSDTIWDVDMVSKKVLWNHGIQDLFGYKKVKYDYQWLKNHVHPDDVERVSQIVEDSIENRRTRWTSEYRFKSANGRYKYVLDRGFLIYDENTGLPVRMIGALQDITTQVEYTKAVEAHNERLKDIAWTQAHLVRAPLARILGLIPLLDNAENDKQERKKILFYIRTSATELDKIIKKIISKSYKSFMK